MWPERSSWKEVGRKRGYSIFAGLKTVNVKLARWRKAQKHRLYHCPEWHAVRRDIPESFRKWEQKAKTSKEECKWQRGKVAHPLSESQWNRGHFSVTKWESEKVRSWSMPVEGFNQGPCGHRRPLVGKDWQVGSMWLGSGAASL